MAEINGIDSTKGAFHRDNIIAPSENSKSEKSEKSEESVWTARENKQIEDVAKHIARKEDGSLDIDTAKKLSTSELFERMFAAMDARDNAETPEEKAYYAEEIRVFDTRTRELELKASLDEELKDIGRDPDQIFGHPSYFIKK